MDSRGGLIAAAVAGLLLTAPACGSDDDDGAETTGTQTGEVKCEGINECAGQSECASADGNSCHGTNECAGQGWVTVDSEEECEEAGGTVLS